MGDIRTISLSIELDPGPEPLTGTVQIQNEPRRPFIGWIELAHLVEQARSLAETDRARDD
ncbi:MAG TPA: hypothetical protein VFW09_17770 [Solirubrobacteraceae bacterium]|nr:hypothetical protein [Solirubrobacteraceae bacterium]